MGYAIEPRFNVEPDEDFKYGVGGYVRLIGEDRGTGMVISRSRGEVLDLKDNVTHQIIYSVHWLDQKDQTGNNDVYSFHAQVELAGSARGVPKLGDMDSADQWLEQQVESGNWTAKAQDATDSQSDIDVALRKMLDEGDA